MKQADDVKKAGRLAWPGRAAALRRLGLIAAILFPCVWIVTALLIGDWNLLGNRDAESFRHLREAAVIFAIAVGIVFLVSLLPTAHRLCRCLFGWRVVRRVLIVCAWIVTVIALFYGEEDWRGRKAWNNYNVASKEQGEELDFKTYVPKPIPDSENFAATPEIQSWFLRHTNNEGNWSIENPWNTDIFAGAKIKQSIESDKIPCRLMDLVAWQKAFQLMAAGRTNEMRVDFESDSLDLKSRAQAAPAILAALKPVESRFDELRAVAGRPYSRYPVVYNLENPWGILLPHLANVHSVCSRLQLRACAELAAGQSDRALQDVKLILRMSDSLNEEPFLISYLVRIKTLQIATQPIWEGLAERHWSDAQLKDLQELMGRYDFITDMERPLDGERAAGALTADLLADGKYLLRNLVDGPEPSGSVFMVLMPRGWYDWEKLNYCTLFNLELKGAFNTADKRVFPDKVEANSTALQQALTAGNRVTRHRFLAALLLPALGSVPLKSALAQTVADEALIACGLERYRLAHGEFPAALDALSPDFISQMPHDAISGTAYKYRRTDGKFVLYSVGWNETDDGGQAATKMKSDVPVNGDWVWQYPTVTN
jgi:hypothetical protein